MTIVIDSLLTRQDKRSRLEKMSMVIETFFSEMGSDLIRHFLRFDQSSEFGEDLNITADWTDAQYIDVKKSLVSYNFNISCDSANLVSLRDFVT